MSVIRRGGRPRSVAHFVLTAAALSAAAVCMVGCNVTSTPGSPTANVPVFTPAPGSPLTQYRGGLSITVTPVAYAVQQRVQTTAVTQTNGVTQMSDGSYAPPVQQPVQQTSTPYLVVMPDRVAFAVTIANGSQHVFRSMGAVAQLSAYGQPLAPGPSDAVGLSDLMILPQNQQQIVVYGPPLQSIASNTPITLTLYDVVTDTDMAGNPMVRQSFSWTFNYQTQCQTLDQLQQAGPPQTVVQQYDQSAGPTYIVVPSSPGAPPGGQLQPPPPRPKARPAAKPKPQTAPPAAVDPNGVPTTAPATTPPPKKKKKPAQ